MVALQIEKLRDETPGCRQVLHFNNAGAALPPLPVVDAVKQHLDLEASIGAYEAADSVLNKIEQVYDNAAKLLNCEREEIAFVENATRAWEMAFYSFKFKAGDKIVTAAAEYVSNYLAFLQMAKHTGVTIDVIGNDATGQLNVEELENKLDDRVKLIAITHVPTQGGLINPAVEIGKIARKMAVPYLLDATQSVGQMPIDVKEIGCDFLCATGRKYLRGPRGTGFLYVKKDKIAQCDPPFIDVQAATWVADNDYVLKPDARRFETWEQNVAGKIGLGVAIQYAMQLGLPTIWERIQQLAHQLRKQLKEIPLIELQDIGQCQCGIVTFTCKSKSVAEIQKQLADRKINVSISLQEYARLDLGKRNISALIRSSVHYYNTEKEVDDFCLAVKSIVS